MARKIYSQRWSPEFGGMSEYPHPEQLEWDFEPKLPYRSINVIAVFDACLFCGDSIVH